MVLSLHSRLSLVLWEYIILLIKANLAAGIVVTLGVSSLIGDGIAMALGDFIATKSENDFNKNERSREEWEV